MLSTLLILAALGQTPKAEPTKCPSCSTAKAVAGQCPELCRCPFPGACGHPGCACKVISGVRAPVKDEWRVFTANPAWEVYGHEWNGVFVYRLRRVRVQVPQVPATQVPAATVKADSFTPQYTTCPTCGYRQWVGQPGERCGLCRAFLLIP